MGGKELVLFGFMICLALFFFYRVEEIILIAKMYLKFHDIVHIKFTWSIMPKTAHYSTYAKD